MRHMHEKTAWALVCALGLFVVATLTSVVSGGPLDPTGPPAPTMKTLQQVEPRTPVQSLAGNATAVYAITQPGSYYLTGDIFVGTGLNGIAISNSYVSLDLNGFKLQGGLGSLDGILVSSNVRSLYVHDGVIELLAGDGLDAALASSSHFEHLRAYDNGGDGLKIGPNSAIEDCESELNSGDGVEVASNGSVITGCTSQSNSGNGILASAGNTTTDSVARQNTLDGINVGSDSIIRGNIVGNNGGDGIEAGAGSFIQGNTASFNGAGTGVGAGIHLGNVGGVRVEDNVARGNDIGIDVDSALNLIIGNSTISNGAAGVTDEYVIVANNTVGPIIDRTTIGTLTNPSANYFLQ